MVSTSLNPFASASSQCDLVVVGAGSGGFAAALSAARQGLTVTLVERNEHLGGNAVHGGVHSWEPGIETSGVARELYERMRLEPKGAAIWSMRRHCCWPDHNTPPFPGGEQVVDPRATYEDTLQRHGTRGLFADAEKVRRQWHGVVFEPDACDRAMRALLTETGRVQILTGVSCEHATGNGGRVRSIHIRSASGESIELSAHWFIDATANLRLCRELGCATWLGEDPRDRFQEPDAPNVATGKINAATLIYRITPVATAAIEPLPAGVARECSFRKNWPVASIVSYPNGDRNINMLPTITGAELLHWLGKGELDEARRIATNRVHGHWHWMQTEYPEFRNYRIAWIAPSLGIRETHRIAAEYNLRQQDLDEGIHHQRHGDIVAVADHAMDLHGENTRSCGELPHAYGIPLRCLIPKGWRNLLVACRGAGFSHIAASSCRLSRTMMDLGHAAGIAVAIASRNQCDVSQIPLTENFRPLNNASNQS